MILDYQTTPCGDTEQRFKGGKCLVDGKDIRACFWIDTEAGIAKTYDVLGDGKAYLFDKLPIVDRAFAKATESGIAYKTVRGSIELFTKDGEKLA